MFAFVAKNIGMERTIDNLQAAVHTTWSSFRKPVVGPRIFRLNECMLHDFSCLDLAAAVRMLDCKIMHSPTYFMLNQEFLAHVFEIAFAHSLESISRVLFDEIYILLVFILCRLGFLFPVCRWMNVVLA